MNKEIIINNLIKTLESQTDILAGWLGGSDATGKSDELSDTDLVLISKDPIRTFAFIEMNLSVIKYRYIVSGTPYAQRFYILEDTDPTYYIDVVVFTDEDSIHYAEYFDYERHGRPVILFDKKEILKRASTLIHSQNTNLDNKNEIAKFEIIYRTFLKEKIRKKYIDAFSFYYRLVLIYATSTRGIKVPAKHDFLSLRYIYIDLPDEAADIENYLKVCDLEQMHRHANEIREKIHHLLQDN